MMEHLFTLMYPLVAIISATAYFPQFFILLKAKSADKNISLNSWLLWIFGGAISLGYGIYVMKDVMFSAMCAFNLTMIAVIVGLVVHNRYVAFGRCKNMTEALIQCLIREPLGKLRVNVNVAPARINRK